MPSKRYIGKPCAYCATGISATTDHVIARKFFLEEDRADLPQVPACSTCNNEKSALELYVMSTLMAGSRHVEAERYRQTMVRPRLARNVKLQTEMGLDRPAVWRQVGSIVQPMHPLTIEADKLDGLMAMIAKGLFHHHFGVPLSSDFYADVAMYRPEHEAKLWAEFQPLFPDGSFSTGKSLGRDSFVYEMVQSAFNPSFTLWRMRWHGGIALHGADTTPDGVSWSWVVTRPTKEAVAKTKAAAGPTSAS